MLTFILFSRVLLNAHCRTTENNHFTVQQIQFSGKLDVSLG